MESVLVRLLRQRLFWHSRQALLLHRCISRCYMQAHFPVGSFEPLNVGALRWGPCAVQAGFGFHDSRFGGTELFACAFHFGVKRLKSFHFGFDQRHQISITTPQSTGSSEPKLSDSCLYSQSIQGTNPFLPSLRPSVPRAGRALVA